MPSLWGKIITNEEKKHAKKKCPKGMKFFPPARVKLRGKQAGRVLGIERSSARISSENSPTTFIAKNALLNKMESRYLVTEKRGIRLFGGSKEAEQVSTKKERKENDYLFEGGGAAGCKKNSFTTTKQKDVTAFSPIVGKKSPQFPDRNSLGCRDEGIGKQS